MREPLPLALKLFTAMNSRHLSPHPDAPRQLRQNEASIWHRACPTATGCRPPFIGAYKTLRPCRSLECKPFQIRITESIVEKRQRPDLVFIELLDPQYIVGIMVGIRIGRGEIFSGFSDDEHLVIALKNAKTLTTAIIIEGGSRRGRTIPPVLRACSSPCFRDIYS